MINLPQFIMNSDLDSDTHNFQILPTFTLNIFDQIQSNSARYDFQLIHGQVILFTLISTQRTD